MAQPLMRSLSTRAVKKLEKPRPLRTSSSQNKMPLEPSSTSVPLQDLIWLVENASQCLQDKNYSDQLTTNIAIMHARLKIHGPQLEAIFKDQLDRAFAVFRDGCQDDGLKCTSRLHLLELVELRANQWTNCDNSLSYYSSKMAASELEPILTTTDGGTASSVPLSAPSPPMPPVLGPGEVIKNSGKFSKPTKIPGKNYCKDEVVIRNSDSGKVNPGAKERLVQITGPSDDKIVLAKQLMEDTIRRNASPVREGSERERMGGSSSSLNSSASDESNRLNQSGGRRSLLLHSYSTNDATLGEYKYTVTLGNETIKLTGTDHDTVRNARLVLEEFYNIWLQKNCIGDCFGMDEDVFVDPICRDMDYMRLNSIDSGMDPGLSYPAMYQPERRAVLGRSNSIPLSTTSSQMEVNRKYSREFLILCATSLLSQAAPPNWEQIIQEVPAIAKKY